MTKPDWCSDEVWKHACELAFHWDAYLRSDKEAVELLAVDFASAIKTENEACARVLDSRAEAVLADGANSSLSTHLAASFSAEATAIRQRVKP